MDQEEYLSKTEMKQIIWRGCKKMATELTSIKSLFLGFICVAMAYRWIDAWSGIIGGLATIGVKEIPSEIFTTIIQRFAPGEKK